MNCLVAQDMQRRFQKKTIWCIFPGIKAKVMSLKQCWFNHEGYVTKAMLIQSEDLRFGHSMQKTHHWDPYEHENNLEILGDERNWMRVWYLVKLLDGCWLLYQHWFHSLLASHAHLVLYQQWVFVQSHTHKQT